MDFVNCNHFQNKMNFLGFDHVLASEIYIPYKKYIVLYKFDCQGIGKLFARLQNGWRMCEFQNRKGLGIRGLG